MFFMITLEFPRKQPQRIGEKLEKKKKNEKRYHKAWSSFCQFVI